MQRMWTRCWGQAADGEASPSRSTDGCGSCQQLPAQALSVHPLQQSIIMRMHISGSLPACLILLCAALSARCVLPHTHYLAGAE
jgi:hypothetical protein